MTTFERLMQDEDFKKKFREGYKKFSLSENEKFVKNRFNFSRRELALLGHEKISELFNILKNFNLHRPIYPGFYEEPLEGHSKSLIEVLLESDTQFSNETKSYINEVISKSEERAKRLFEEEQNELEIYHSEAEQEFNLYCNLLDL